MCDDRHDDVDDVQVRKEEQQIERDDKNGDHHVPIRLLPWNALDALAASLVVVQRALQ